MAYTVTDTDPSKTATPVNTVGVLVFIGVLAALIWSVTRAHSCGGSWPAAAVRGVFASGLSFSVAAWVAYLLSVPAAAAFFSGTNYMVFYGLAALVLASFFGIGTGGITLLTRCT